MKSAMLLAKHEHLFELFANYLKGLEYPFVGENGGSICLNPDGEYRFQFYDRQKKKSFFEQYEIPEKAASLGYLYGYMIECRSERLFCEIVRHTPPEIDILVCDSNSDLFKPSEVQPDSIAL